MSPEQIMLIPKIENGFVLDHILRRPVLANRMGGLSGPAILPLSVRAVWEIAEAVPLPIIGTGGVETAEDVVQMALAGATAVGIGTAVYTRGLDVFSTINSDLHVFMQERGITSLSELKGAAHV